MDEFSDGRSMYEAWDMSGNVYECCQDHYDDEYYRVGIGVNPTGFDGGQERTIRGGSYQETRAALRAIPLVSVWLWVRKGLSGA